jgi:hypothetical protein
MQDARIPASTRRDRQIYRASETIYGAAQMRSLLKFDIHVVKYDDTVSGATGLWKEWDTNQWIISREVADNGQRVAYVETFHKSHFFAMKEFETACVVSEVEANNHALWKMKKVHYKEVE